LNLAGLSDDKYRKGNIEVFGRQMKKKNIYGIREDIGFVFQDPNDQLFSTSVFDDVAFGLVNFLNKNDNSKAKDREYIKKIVSMSLKSVNMDGTQDTIPHFLSFGEKKLVALATVLSYSPGLLLLDEPASNLDPGNRNNFIGLLKSMDKTIIAATHDLDMAWEFSERCIIINEGMVVFDGSTKKVLKDAQFLRRNNLDLPLRFIS
jgi:energy-coupling factor transporter ATP-binding protein EcfA2